MKGDRILNVILACTACGAMVEGADYPGNVARIHSVRFPGAVTPFRCESCTAIKPPDSRG